MFCKKCESLNISVFKTYYICHDCGENTQSICLNCQHYYGSCHGTRQGCDSYVKFDNDTFKEDYEKIVGEPLKEDV